MAVHHLRFISQTPGAVIAGLVDENESAARDLAQRYKASAVGRSLDDLLERTPVDVLHVLTPPFHHYCQASAAIERGVHVLVEKPLTFRASETEDLYRRAAAKGVLVCPDFIQLFHPAFLKARQAVSSGELGRVIRVEACLSETLYLHEMLETGKLHWSFQLPGGILHNYITHPLYLALYFLGSPQKLIVRPRSLGVLPQGLTDHLEVMIDTAEGSGYVMVSHAVQPKPSYFVNIFCEKGVVSVNFDTSTTLVSRSGKLPRAVERASSNFTQASDLLFSGAKNILDFARGRLVPYQGLQALVPSFYEAIRNGTSPPISPELAKAVVRCEEEVLSQAGKLHLDLQPRQLRKSVTPDQKRVLVTGASGYLGKSLVRVLMKEGYAVRALVRPLGHIESLEELGAEIFFGDVRDLQSVVQATEGMDIIVHAAAGLRGSAKHILDSCVVGTQNIVHAANQARVGRVIYVSSMSVYDFFRMKNGSVITEETPLDDHPEFRGAYSLGKRKAEEAVLAHLGDDAPAWTILRPSVIVGESKDVLKPIDAFQIGRWIVCMGSPAKKLRLIHVRDVAGAIVRSLREDSAKGKVFVLSSPETVTLRDYIATCVRPAKEFRNARVLYMPFWFAKLAVASLAVVKKVLGKGPSLNLRKLAAVYRDVRVDSTAVKQTLDWAPGPGLLDRLKTEGMALQKGC